ncbi:MAG: glycosyltransferase family 1 protein [Gammaproteobacteria bacterium]|nr:MAG: glycosyltransferase family 1 protein [Gammaproteobacteria bacterium]
MGCIKVSQSSILIMLHCDEATGYAISSLEFVFLNAARKAGFSDKNIFWSFKNTVTKNDPHIIKCGYFDHQDHLELQPFIKRNNIDLVLAFDLGFPCPVISELKKAGVKHIISYFGAGMSSINSGIKLMLKKLEYRFTKNKPDVFIFESEAMRATATHGRGISENATEIIYLGVDIQKFFPNYNQDTYIHKTLGVPENRKIIFYSGHMEERKGVRVIVKAAIHLVETLNISNVHFVICGNKNNEADSFEKLLDGKRARNHVTFAGYRSDIPELMRSSYAGVIASTGWDSFTMSSVEMMASGLPLIVSDLQGLSETIEANRNGFLVFPGDHEQLAQNIKTLITQPDLAKNFSIASRKRAEKLFSVDVQINEFSKLIKQYM